MRILIREALKKKSFYLFILLILRFEKFFFCFKYDIWFHSDLFLDILSIFKWERINSSPLILHLPPLLMHILPRFYRWYPDFINIFNHHLSIENFSKLHSLWNSICAVYNFKNFENRTKTEHDIWRWNCSICWRSRFWCFFNRAY